MFKPAAPQTDAHQNEYMYSPPLEKSFGQR